jgi:replicative DNA helicase
VETRVLEYRILSLLRNKEAFLKYAPIVKDNLFESKETKQIFKLISFYHKKSKGTSHAPISSLFALVNSRVKSNEAKKYLDIIKSIKKYPLNDAVISDDIVKRFVKNQIVKMTILDMANALDKEDDLDVEKIRARFDEILMAESSELMEDAYDYFQNPTQRLQHDRDEPRIATLLSPDLDRAMRRGLAGGEIAFIVAPTNVGKTMFLINIAYNAIKQGKLVLYVTLELSGKKIAGRFDQIVTGKGYEYLWKHPNIVYRATKKLRRMGGGLKIKDYTASKLSPNELHLFLERIRKEFKFDMIIVDQLDLMYSPKEYKERRHELSSLTISMRRLGAVYNVPVWTASQATRIAGASGSTTMWDIAEDIGKANWSDIVVTLSQDDEAKEQNVMFLDLVKNRIGEGNPRVMLSVGKKTMILKGMAMPKKGIEE